LFAPSTISPEVGNMRTLLRYVYDKYLHPLATTQGSKDSVPEAGNIRETKDEGEPLSCLASGAGVQARRVKEDTITGAADRQLVLTRGIVAQRGGDVTVIDSGAEILVEEMIDLGWWLLVSAQLVLHGSLLRTDVRKQDHDLELVLNAVNVPTIT